MPIRFRCAYCQQLMGIARRKAGAVVRCPRCAGEVIVPPTHEIPDANGAGQPNDHPESEESGDELAAIEPAARDAAAREPGGRDAPNQLMPPPSYTNAPVAAGQASSTGEPAGTSAAWNVRRSEVFMPTPMLIVSLALLVASLAVMFGLGCVVGRWMGP
jgi:DNA-directed RNA polymerase subunit RPC12/RpoP